jgi:hypothetical protein
MYAEVKLKMSAESIKTLLQTACCFYTLLTKTEICQNCPTIKLNIKPLSGSQIFSSACMEGQGDINGHFTGGANVRT